MQRELLRWELCLDSQLEFLFEAEILDDPRQLELGDHVKVIQLDGNGDLYGILAVVKHGRRKFIFPLCDLEIVGKTSKNYQLLDAYRDSQDKLRGNSRNYSFNNLH